MDWKKSFEKYAKEQAPNEACGLFAIIEGKKVFWPCKNLAEGKHEFFVNTLGFHIIFMVLNIITGNV